MWLYVYLIILITLVFEAKIQIFCKMTDVFAPVSNSVIVGCSWTLRWWVPLIPCMEASVITMETFAPSQSDLGCVKLEYCLNRFVRSSSLVGLCSHTISIIFICDNVFHDFIYGGFSWLHIFGRVVWLLFGLYILPFFHRKHLVVLILNDMPSPDLICCKAWNDMIPVQNILLLFLLSLHFCRLAILL